MAIMNDAKSPKNKEKIAVVGLGYIGLPLALLASRKGYEVFGIDTNEERVAKLTKRKAPFAEESIAGELATTTLKPTSDFSVIKDVSVIIICVPTPVHENHMPDLEPVRRASRALAPYLHRDQLVILESTVNPGVSENIVLPILEKGSGLKGSVDFYLAHCPERINPGDTTWNVENIPRVVGSLEEQGLERAVSFYRSVLTGSLTSMGSLKEAEAVKIVENSFRDINIAFVNELARSFSRLGIDIVRVIDGAATKPFAFMAHYPGCGVGGHCIPVDPYYLIEYAKNNGFDHDFLVLARRINNGMPAFTVELLLKALNQKGIAAKGARIAVLGLAYKPDIDDCRESPAYHIIKELKDLGAEVVTYDPHVLGESSVASLEEALSGAKAVIIATGHKMFRALKPSDFLIHGIGIVVDGRNCLAKEDFVKSGIVYRGIGR